MFETKITRMFGTKYPVVGGTMMWISTPKMVAAICEAGALGILASAMYQSKEDFRDAIREVRDLTDQPFAVNLNLFPMMSPVDNNDFIDVILEEGVGIVETSGHRAPEEYVARLKSSGVKTIHKVVGVRYARKAASIGVDVVTVVGYENGGATGMLDIASLVLIPSVVDAVSVPVIGGGGVADGRGFLSVLALGAEAVIVGTMLLTTEECPIHRNVKEALLTASEVDTTLVMRSIKGTHRVLKNSTAEKVVQMEAENATLEELYPLITGENTRKLLDEGNLETGMLACGQAVGLAREILPMKEAIGRLVTGADEIRGRLAALG